MKKLRIAAGAVVACVLLVLVALRVVGLDPHGRRPGLWLTGQPVTTPVTDWSFTDQHQTIYVQTRSWYGLPHSVTTTVTAYNGRLYLTSVYRPGMRFPDDRLWNKNILRDPRVRLKIGDRVFDGVAALVTDPAEKDSVLGAKAKKYPGQRATDRSLVHVFRIQTG
jgi:F420H(2)-dependent quinone reductase